MIETATLVALAVWLCLGAIFVILGRDDEPQPAVLWLLATPICITAALGGLWLVFATIASGVKFGWTMLG